MELLNRFLLVELLDATLDRVSISGFGYNLKIILENFLQKFELSRRRLFLLGQGLLAYTAFPASVFAADSQAKEANLGAMSRETFTAVLRTAFNTRAADKTPVTLVLTAVEDMTPSETPAGTPALDTFALEFSGAGETLSQGTYHFTHNRLGMLTLFIVPSGDASYTAVINHLKTPLPAAYSIPVRQQQAVPVATGTRPASLPEIPASRTIAVRG
jgi:hypothetical protein